MSENDMGDQPGGGVRGDRPDGQDGEVGVGAGTGPHLREEFRDRFPTWLQLRRFVDLTAPGPEFDSGRAMQQLVMADLFSILNRSALRWHLLGSLALPVRPHPDDPWTTELRPSQTGVHPAYCTARAAFDLDLFAFALRDSEPSDYAADVVAAVHDVAPPSSSAAAPSESGAEPGSGLGGLVRYSANGLTVHDSGQVMGTLTVQPVDDRYGPGRTVPVDDPMVIELDIKPPSKMGYVGLPDRAHRSVVGLDLPGLNPVLPDLFPIANQIADKLILLTGPPTSLRGQNTAAWHRYKDLVDLYFLVSTCRVGAALLHQAVTTNWNWMRMDHYGLPAPYRVYGQAPLRLPGERRVPWDTEIDAMRARLAPLRGYPRFDAIVDTVARFTSGLAALGDNLDGRRWTPGQGWHLVPPTATQEARRAVSAATQLYRSPAPPGAADSPRTVLPPSTGHPSTPDHRRGRGPAGHHQ